MVLKPAKQKQISFGYCDPQTGQRVYPPPPPPEMTELLPEQQPPPQGGAAEANGQEGMGEVDMKIASYPPLGQSTSIARDNETVQFQVLVETPKPRKGLDVRLWHNHQGEHNWNELPLKPVPIQDDNDEAETKAGRLNTASHQYWVTGKLQGLPNYHHVVSFTFKYRTSDDAPWQWIKDTADAKDGELHYFSPHMDISKNGAHDLSKFFENISSDVNVDPENAETDGTLLYSLTCSVSAADGENSGYAHHQLGKAVHMSRWFSLVRLWSPWLAPRQGRGHFELDREGILVSFLRSDGYHVVCLAISGVGDMVTTFISEKGNIVIKGRNDSKSKDTARVLVAVAENFEVANAAVMYHARKVVAQYASAPADANMKALLNDSVKPKFNQEWYDGLTYCTWNGLGQNLTAQKIYDALDDLKANDINITNLIIDDNWQHLGEGDSQFKRAWSGFEANKQGFPDGLKGTTKTIRDRHPNVRHIAVWHALLGYWGGVNPESELADKYKVIEVEKEPGVAGGTFWVVAAEDARRMYDDFYRFLAQSGVDSVKTDAQFFLDMLLHAPDRRSMTKEYQDAWTQAHVKHLSTRAISCMSQSPQILFYEQLPKNKPRLMVRNSDDFFPEVEASHPWHIFCNAHNSILTQHLNVLPDWDMFQTSHPWSGFHAAARCVSGGPIYFTDEPGKHDIELMKQMTAQTLDGKTIILRPHTIGKATDVYNSYDAQALVRIATYVGFAHTGTSIVGFFNVTQKPITELVKVNDFPGTEKGQYVIGTFTSGKVSRPIRRGQFMALVGVKLEKRGWEILTAYPLRSFEVKQNNVSVAMMGLIDKMTGSAAVTAFDAYVEENGRLKLSVELKALGVLGVYISDLPTRKVDDMMVLMDGDPIPSECVKKSQDSSKVLKIDVAEAWKRTGEEPGYRLEVNLAVFLS